jgi:hypothetical protein
MTAAETGDALGDAITIIRARGRWLSKLISATGAVESYDAARTFEIPRVVTLCRIARHLVTRSTMLISPRRRRGLYERR